MIRCGGAQRCIKGDIFGMVTGGPRLDIATPFAFGAGIGAFAPRSSARSRSGSGVSVASLRAWGVASRDVNCEITLLSLMDQFLWTGLCQFMSAYLCGRRPCERTVAALQIDRRPESVGMH